MSGVDPAQKAPTNDLVVFGFCELWAILLGLPPGEDLYHGQPMSAHMITFLAIGSTFAILGPAWPWVKSRFPRRWSATFVRCATDFRWWMVVLLIGFIVPSLMDRFFTPMSSVQHRLSDPQRANLIERFNAGPDISSKVRVFAYTSCVYCERYAWDFAGLMNSVPNWTSNKNITVVSRVDNINIDQHGVVIGVPTMQTNLSAYVLAHALDGAKIPYLLTYEWQKDPFKLQQDGVILLIMPED
jgi:hypothetical protein